MSRFNLDAVSGQALATGVEQAVQAARSGAWADPDSLHFEGKQAAQLLQLSHESVGTALGIARENIAFGMSSSAVVRDLITAIAPSVIIRSAIERQVVIDATDESDCEVREIGVTESGHLQLSELTSALTLADANTLVFVQWANQEVGTIQDLSSIYQLVTQAGALLAVDATSGLGYLNSKEARAEHGGLPCDFVFADSASWGGSRVATVIGWTGSLAPGASRSGLLRSGTDLFTASTSVAEAATAAVTLESLRVQQPAESERLSALRAKLEEGIRQQYPQADLVNPGELRLPHVTTFSLPYVDAEALAVELDRQGIAIGSGSACANDVGVPSHVLAAIGSLTQGNVRVSLPIGCPEEAIDRLLELLPQVAGDLTTDIWSTDPDDKDEAQPDNLLDERGELCPHPVIELAKAANRLASGSTITVITDDPAALSDIPAWTRLQNATIVSQELFESNASDEKPATQFVVKLP